MRQAKYKLLKLSTLAIAIAATGGCVSAKVNTGDMAAEAAPATEVVVVEEIMVEEMVTDYTVAKNDNLWSISGMGEIYGTPYNWPLIYKSNASQINDADLIFPGQVLDIPRGSSQSAIDAAVMHAKTRGAWSLGTTEASDTAYLDG
jgi:nucleoid-associated protein YgaU